MTEETFVRELERRADHVHGAPLSFEDVRGRARSIRRRRRTAVASAVAAAVAAVVLVPTVLTGGSDRTAPDPAPPTPTAPGASVLHDGVVTRPDGSTVPVGVDNSNVMQLGVLTDGRVVLALQKPYAVRVYGADGTLQDQFPVEANVLTMSAADDVVAWVGADFRVQVLSSGAEDPVAMGGIPMPGETAGSIDAVLDAGHLLVGDFTTTSGELTADGVRDLPTSEPFRVTDVNLAGDLWAVSFIPGADNEQYGCSGLYDPEAGEVVARSCDVNGLAFAPDGAHLLSGYYENNMAGDVQVVDLDLEPVRTIDPEGRTTVVSRAAWVDADHVLAATADWRTSVWSLLRASLVDPEPDVVDGPVDGRNPEILVEFLLSD